MSKSRIRPKVTLPMAERLMLRWGAPAHEGVRSGGPSRSELLAQFQEVEGSFMHPDFPEGFSRKQLDEAILISSAANLLFRKPGRKLSLPDETCALSERVSKRSDFSAALVSGQYRMMLKAVLEEILLSREASLPKLVANEPASGQQAPEEIGQPPSPRERQVLSSVYVDESLFDNQAKGPEARPPEENLLPLVYPDTIEPSADRLPGPQRQDEESDRTRTRKLKKALSFLGPPEFVTQFEGIGIPDHAESAVRESARNSLRGYSALMENLVRANPDAFTPIYTLDIAPTRVMICAPVDAGRYDTIPVFVQNGDQFPRLVFGYRSKSQDSWRRFAGMAAGIYWKGGSEHLQNFDWRIQKAMDQIFDVNEPRPMPDGFRDLALLSIDDPYLVVLLENKIQDKMSGWTKPLDILSELNRPHYLVDHWWSGKNDEGYDRHLNIVARSRNNRYLYAMAITGEGLVPKFVQLQGESSINELGAPRFSVAIGPEDQWILTPIVEYASQKDRVWEVTGEHLVINGTIALGGNRVRIKGVHQSPESPFFELDNGMEEFYRLIRSSGYEAAEHKLRRITESGGVLPRSEDPATLTAPNEGTINWRYSVLSHAFSLYYWGQLDPSTAQGQALMANYVISERDLAVFRRYAQYVKENLLPDGNLAEHVQRQVAEKLWGMSRQWSGDIHAKTVKIEL